MNRINQPALPRTAPRIDFGLIAWLEKTRTRLPLKEIDCRFEVSGDVASVEIDQVFHQINSVAVNCTYTFPLPGNAAVYRCEIQIGSRTIQARVEEQTKARQLFTEKLAAGHRAGLVETERDNLFTLSLGNIQPNDIIVVRLAYFQTVDRSEDEVSLLVPFCPGVRYIAGKPLWRESRGKGTMPDTDQVPDASRITPPRIEATHEDAAYVSIQGRLESASIDADSIASPLHQINVQKEEAQLLIRLQLDADIPDRDFVLRWRESSPISTTANGWAYEADGHSYALVQVKAPEKVTVAESYEQDHYFLIDRSGSMEGDKWLKTAEALKQFVRQLGASDRVWLTFFETNFVDFAERLMTPSELLKDNNFNRIETRGTGGGTEMLPALHHVLEKVNSFSGSEARQANLIIITDGQIGNESAVLEALRPWSHLRVFTFGIDLNVNDAFLRDLARRQRGAAIFRTPHEDISGAVSALGTKLRKPVLTNIKASGGWEPAQSNIPDLFENDLLLLPLRSAARIGSVEFTGQLPNGRTHSIAIEPRISSNLAIKLLWARQRIQHLLDEERQAEAIQLGIANNIICKGAAFIAWDEQEKVAVAQKEIYQPSLVEAGKVVALHSFQFSKRIAAARFETRDVGIVMETLGGSAEGYVGKASSPLESILGESGGRLNEALLLWARANPHDLLRRFATLKKLYAELLKHAGDREKCKQVCLEFVRKKIVERELQDLLDAFIKQLKQSAIDPSAWRQLCTQFLQRVDSSKAEEILRLAEAL